MSVVDEEKSAGREVAEAFIRRAHGVLIDGKWLEAATGDTFETRDPATEEVLAEVALSGAAEVDAAVAAAGRAVAPTLRGVG